MASSSASSGASGGTPPESVEEALARARTHGRTAAAESVAALQALLDALALTLSGRAAERDAILGPLSRGLDELRALAAPDDSRLGASLLDAVFTALDAEIARWESRSREDPNARSVLRAFLAVREILWEMSAGRGAPHGARARQRPDARGKARPGRSARPRRGGPVRRVPVEG